MKVALIGFGTVNRGAWEIIQDRKDEIRSALGQELEITHIVLRPESVKRGKEGIDPALLTSDYDQVLEEVDLVVEATGALEEGFAYMKKALEKGVGVVTANKAVVSRYFEDLHALSKKTGAGLMYEAAVGGGIPVLTPLRGIQVANKVSSIRGILNGTCNYLLNKMYDDGADYGETLALCQDLGYAEQDPTDDVEGFDAMRKLRILTSMALAPIKEEDIICRGISQISKEDLDWARKSGLKVKLVAEARLQEGRLLAVVEPVMLDANDPLAALPDAINGVYLTGDHIGDVSFTGPGAGKDPTGHAIVQDLIDLARKSSLPILPKDPLPIDKEGIQASYYVRGGDLPDDMVKSQEGQVQITHPLKGTQVYDKLPGWAFVARMG